MDRRPFLFLIPLFALAGLALLLISRFGGGRVERPLPTRIPLLSTPLVATTPTASTAPILATSPLVAPPTSAPPTIAPPTAVPPTITSPPLTAPTPTPIRIVVTLPRPSVAPTSAATRHLAPRGKKGLAWAYAGDYPDDYRPFGIHWYHNWDVFGPVDGDTVQFVPFITCDTNHLGHDLIRRAVQVLGGSYDGYLLILNEPDLFDPDNPQCDTPPAAAAELYLAIRSAFPRARLIGPNISHRHLRYTEEWRAAVRQLTGAEPQMAGYAIHSYAPQAATTLERLDRFYSMMVAWGEGDKELWLTEFGFCQNESGWDDPAGQLTRLLAALESPAYGFVTRYAYFTTRQRGVPATPAPGTPGPPPEPTPTTWEICFTDLYQRYSYELSLLGEVYAANGR